MIFQRMSKTLLSVIAGGIILVLLFVGQFYLARRDAPPITYAAVVENHGSDIKKIEVAGVDVAYLDQGNGPVLVLLHGSFSNMRMFDEMAEILSADYRVLRYDQPPVGFSGTVPEGFSLTMEAFLNEFLNALDLDEVSLLGTSSGGIIGYRFAATYPERLNALILSNIPPSAPVDNEAARSRLPLRLRWSMETCIKYAKPFSRTCWRDFLLTNFHRQERITDALVEQYYDLNRRPGTFVYTSMTAIMRDDSEVISYLEKVESPTLIIWGMLDPVLPPEMATLLASRLSSAAVTTVTLADVSHYPPLEAPVEVAQASHQFLQSTAIQKNP